MAGIELHIYL